jgi:hypothetical protein
MALKRDFAPHGDIGDFLLRNGNLDRQLQLVDLAISSPGATT